MRVLITAISFLLFAIPSLAQSGTQDSCKMTPRSSYKGTMEEISLKQAAYSFAVYDDYAYIEFQLTHFGPHNLRIRVESRCNNGVHALTVSKTYRYSDATPVYIAIDSTVAPKIKKNKKVTRYLEKERILERVTSHESIYLYYISVYIQKHGLEREFFDFKPKSLIGWLKVKGKDGDF